MDKNLCELFAQRRSIYNLGSKQILPEEKITTIITDALKFCPSAFNSQSARLVVLYGEYYQKLWDIVLTELSKIVPEDKMGQTITKSKLLQPVSAPYSFLKMRIPLKVCKKSFLSTAKIFQNGLCNQTVCCNI